MSNATVTAIRLHNGQVLIPSKNLTLIVGPNNVGKSVLLTSLHARLGVNSSSPVMHTPVVESITIELPTLDDMLLRLGNAAQPRRAGVYANGQFFEDQFVFPNGSALTKSRLTDIVQTTDPTSMQELRPMLCLSMTPEMRLNQLGQVATPNLYNEGASTPLQMFYINRELEARLSEYALRAFDMTLTVNRHGGAQIGLHVGRPAAAEPRIGEKTDYQRQVLELPQAASQGHGVQAYLGMLMALTAQQYDVVLIDEPEAFLHPPQARLLGEIFVELSRDRSQVIVSTHSNDFVQGVLSAAAAESDVTLARLTRPAFDVNHVAQIAPHAVRKLYEEPLLRYSNILNGIFYKGTVLCESESDCKYYSAVLDEMYSGELARGAKPDMLFTHCNGKHRLADAVRALRAAGVPTAVIADLDVLNDNAVLDKLVGALGGTITGLAGQLNSITAAVDQRSRAVDRVTVRTKLDAILAAKSVAELASSEVQAIQEAIKRHSGWQDLKEHGRHILSGQALTALDSVLIALAHFGLHLVPAGELESFHREIGGNKSRWIRTVFETEAYKSSPGAVELLWAAVETINKQQ